MQKLWFAILFGFSWVAQGAPLGISPGVTDLSKAKAILGEPQSTPIPEARYRFGAPSGSGFSGVELYIGRQSGVVEIAQYLYEPATDAAILRTALKQKEPDLRYTTNAGDACEVYFHSRTRLLLTKEGKAKAIDYLSAEALRLLLTEVTPFAPDRTTPEGAFRAIVAGLYTGKDSDLTASVGGAKSAAGLEVAFLQKMRPEFLVALDGATIAPPTSKVKAKDATIKVNHPLYGALEFAFLSTEKGWMLSSVGGALEPIEKTATTPRAALKQLLKSVTAMPTAPAVKGPTLPDLTAIEGAFGKEWPTALGQMVITNISQESGQATLTLQGNGKGALVVVKPEAKLWRVTELKPLPKP